MIDPSQRRYFPGRLDRKIDDRKERFASLNSFVRERGGWLTSVPGAATVTMACLPDSPIPDRLRDLGYVVEQIGVSESILPFSVTERFTRGPGGELRHITPGSTEAVVETRHHAGITKVLQFEFDIP